MKKILFYIILLLFQVTNMYGQLSHSLHFVPLAGSRNFDDIHSILPDSKGFLWFGCNQGLVRYNGNSYQLFEPDATNKTIATNAITTLHEDGNGTIWIGTANKGLYNYTYQADTFTHFTNNALPNAIVSVDKCYDGIIVTTLNAVYILDKINKVSQLAWPNNAIKNNITIVKTIQGIDKNIVWLLTSNGLYSYNLQTSSIKQWHGYGYSVDEVGNVLSCITITNDNKVFTATKNKGLIELDVPTNTVTIHSFSQNKSTAYTSNNIDALLPFDDDHVMVATQDSGVAVYNKSTNNFSFLKQNNFTETNNYHFQVKAMGANTQFVTLATQHDGIWIYNKADQLFKTVAIPSSHNTVNGTVYARSLMVSSNTKEVFVGSFFGDGMYLVNTENNAIKSFAFEQNGSTKKTLIVNAIYKDKNGVIWVATQENGLLLFNEKSQHLFSAAQQYTILQKYTSSKNYCFYEDQQSNLYIVTGENGLLQLDAKRQNIFQYVHNEKDSTSIVSNQLFAEKVFSDIKNRLWLSTKEGITVLDKATQKFYHFTNQPGHYNSIPASFWYAFEQDDQGHIYIGTSNGLFKINADATSINNAIHFTTTNGLLHNTIFSMVKDKHGLLWITCRNGLSCFNTKTNSFTNFTYKNGLPSKTLMSPSILAEDGTIYHGAVEKYFSFNPTELLSHQTPNKIWFTGCKVLNKDTIVGLATNQLKKLQLTHSQHSFSFSFIVPTLLYANAITYSYMLEGFDKEWTKPESTNNATYTNVPPGNYVFKVKAIGVDGKYLQEISSIEVIITPPFWQLWWFKAVGITTLIAVCMYVLKRREKYIATKEAAKTEIEKLKGLKFKHELHIEQVINYFASSIYEKESIDELLWDVTKNCISKLDFEDCVIYLVDEKRNVLVQKAAWGPKTSEENKIINPIEIALGTGIVGNVALHGKSEIINDTSLDERYIEDDERRNAELAVPIISNNIVIGVIDSEHSVKGFYTEKHQQILLTIASLLGDKINKIKAEQITKAKEIEIIELSKDVANWQIVALTSQMNPHFIFNALNSIQQFTLKNEVDNANLYLSKFSTLLRKVLQSSQQPVISLAEEIAQLSLYIEIEKLRMGSDFTYQIVIDDEVEIDFIQIPGMLLQPFVENAFKHGLPLKEGPKVLTIHINMLTEQQLQVSIIDNGIGRTQANAIQQQQKLMPHVSKGISLVQKRLKLLQHQHGQMADVIIEDVAQNGGTKILLIIPIP